MSGRAHQSDDSRPSVRATPPQAEVDEALAALSELLSAADQMEEVIGVVRYRAPAARDCLSEGLPFSEVLGRLQRPLVGEVLYDSLNRFEAAGTRCRRVLAVALRREGQTLQQIGDLWGITRQRVSELLQDATEVPPEPPLHQPRPRPRITADDH